MIAPAASSEFQTSVKYSRRRPRRIDCGIVESSKLGIGLWPQQDPVGQQCIAEWGPLQREPSEVVGVAGDIRTRLDRPPLDIVYVADSWGAQETPSAPGSASIVVHTNQSPSALASAVRTSIHRAGPDVPIVALRSMSEVVSLNVEGRRFQASLTSSFAVSALLLGALGIFGVLAYSVEQRRREFAIRSALGATRSSLLQMVISQGLRPVAFGLAAGIVAAILGGNALRSLVFGVAPFDLLTFFVVTVVVVVVGAASCYVPALRATRIVPTVALRYE